MYKSGFLDTKKKIIRIRKGKSPVSGSFLYYGNESEEEKDGITEWKA